MSNRHSKAGTITTTKDSVVQMKKTNLEWKEHNGLCYPFPSADNKGGEDREVELQAQGKVIKSFLQGGKFGHTLKIECNDNDPHRIKDFIATDPKAKEIGFKRPINENVLTMSNKEEGKSEFKSIWDGQNIDVSDIAQRKYLSANYIQKDVEVYVEFTVTGCIAKNNYGSSLKLLSVGLVDDGTAAY